MVIDDKDSGWGVVMRKKVEEARGRLDGGGCCVYFA